MDQYYHHHYQPQNQWRQPPPPPAQQPNKCPVCSIPHFPFCPPYPTYHPQNPSYPPHYARPGFDPYQPPLPPTPPPPPPPPPPAVSNHPLPYIDGFSDPRSWHQNPNYGYDYATVGAGGEVDRSYKRPRVEEFGSGPGPGPGPGLAFSEDERRLKLIHDHGGASLSGFNHDNRYLQNNVNNNNSAISMPPRSSEMYNIEDSLNNCNNNDSGNNNYSYNQQHQIQHKDSMPGVVNNWQGYEQRIGGYMQQPGGNNMLQPPPPPPPLPASPPPPLPTEPPVQHHPSSEFKAYSSPSNSSFSLFPIPVSSSSTAHSNYAVVPEPYHQNKPPPRASVGFIGEVMVAFLIAPLVF